MTGGALAPRHSTRAVALAVLCGVLLLTFLDNTIVAVVLGDVQGDLHSGVSALQWVVNGYALAFAAVMLPAGAIGDEFGRRTVLLSGVGLFCAGALVCALAPNTGTLVAGRVVMGLGAAGSEPGTLSLVRHLYPEPARRTRAVSLWAATAGVALALGPVVGGALDAAFGWRSIFWFSFGLGLLLLAGAAALLPESADPTAARVDAAGGLFGMVALAAAIYAVIDGESAGYTAPRVLALLAVAAVAAIGFWQRERRAAHPVLDPATLRLPRFAIANLLAFASYFGVFAVFFFTALYLNEVAGYSGYRIAGQLAPMTAAIVLASLAAGRWAAGRGGTGPMFAGCLLLAAGLLATDTTLSPRPPYAGLAASLAVAGIGIGLVVVPVTDTAMAAVPGARSGMAASAVNTSRELGAVVGVAALGALVDARLTGYLAGALHRLGIPASFQGLVVHAVETGAVPSSGHGAGNNPAAVGHASLVTKVIHAAYAAFGSALSASLEVAAALVLAAALVSAVTLALTRRRPGRPVPGDG